jgi:hypothetical protein
LELTVATVFFLITFVSFQEEAGRFINLNFKIHNIMSLDITGKVVQLGQRQTGQGKNGTWVKQDLIIETEEQFPKKVCLTCWGDKAEEATTFKPGEQIKASINVESREYNGRWYTDLKPWRFDRINSADNQSAPLPPSEAYPADPSFESEGDDLPF